MDPMHLGRGAVTFAVLLGSLGLVTWRQSRSFEALAELDELRRQTSVALAERVELERDIQILRSRAEIVPAAALIGLHTPHGNELALRYLETGS